MSGETCKYCAVRSLGLSHVLYCTSTCTAQSDSLASAPFVGFSTDNHPTNDCTGSVQSRVFIHVATSSTMNILYTWGTYVHTTLRMVLHIPLISLKSAELLVWPDLQYVTMDRYTSTVAAVIDETYWPSTTIAPIHGAIS